MKKILLAILILFFSCQVCTAAEEEVNNIFTNDPQDEVELHGYLEYDEMPTETIYLEEQPEPINYIQLNNIEDKKNLNLKTRQKVGSKSLISSKLKQTPITEVKSFDTISKFSTPEYNIAPVNSSYSVKTGNISFGTSYDMGISKAQQNYTTGIFTRYDGSHYAVTSAVNKSAKSRFDDSTDSLYLAPELKLTKRLSVLNAMEVDTAQTYRSSELILRYKPKLKKYADDVQVELGAGQTFYDTSSMKSTLRFSTRFRL